ncbi:hypothetical protein DPMN_112678 [Dreissena polymorpha]|uniref:Uncharacterized protein n=1 Tax=Dreissena polymorpha TaxID=45954 RepID=A0A9D4QQV6_DREPO|nr:hypothetical protein DPMN_112678 [Dreissena polymorpha]
MLGIFLKKEDIYIRVFTVDTDQLWQTCMNIYPVKGRTNTLNIPALSVRRIHLTGKVTKVWVKARCVVVSGTSGKAVVVVTENMET